MIHQVITFLYTLSCHNRVKYYNIFLSLSFSIFSPPYCVSMGVFVLVLKMVTYRNYMHCIVTFKCIYLKSVICTLYRCLLKTSCVVGSCGSLCPRRGVNKILFLYTSGKEQIGSYFTIRFQYCFHVPVSKKIVTL